MKSITRNLLESLNNNEAKPGMTLYDYIVNVCNGEIDMDVCDKDIDMTVAFCHNVDDIDNEYPEMTRFLNLLAKKTKIVKQHNSSYGPTLECDFSSALKPYNEQWKEFFNMDNSEFDEDEAYYEAVLNLEPLISGNASESTYKEINDILEGKLDNNNNEITNEADNLESTIDEAARYLFDEGDKDYLPDYEEFNDSIMEISKDLFDKAKERALEALTNLAEHQYYDHDGGYGTVLELNDNHTMWELTNEKKSDEEWASIVQSKLAQFKADTGVELMLLGRMGRHACVEPTYDNCMNFTYLQETQEKLEQEAIDEFNAEEMNESVDLTAEATYHDEDGTRDYVAGKLSDGRYFIIGQQEQILVSDKDLPSLAKRDMDDYRYDEDGDKEFIEALENGTTLDKNSDLAKIIINASRKYLDDGCYLLSESVYTTDDGTPANIVADNIMHADSDPRFQTKEQVNDEKLCADLADFALETTDEEYWNKYSDEGYYEKNKRDYMKQINDINFVKGVVDLLETRLRNLDGVDEEYDTESLLAEFKEKLNSLEKPMNESEKQLYVFSNAQSYDKSDADSWADTYSKEAPNLKFRVHKQGDMYFVDFIGSKEDIIEYIKKLDWFSDEEIESMDLIKPYRAI